MTRRAAIALALLCGLALAAVLLAAQGGDEQTGALPPASPFEGGTMPAGVRAPDFALRDQDGRLVSMRRFRGRPVVVTFLYTTCRETCPGQAQTVKGALNDLGHDVPAIAISVDPPRDTPARARHFLAEQRMTGRMRFVLGSRAELRPLWRRWAIRPQSPRYEHQAHFILVDKRGFERVGFPLDQATSERLAHDLRVLERE